MLIALAVAWVYLTLVRFVDVNEREPVWALAIVFLLGFLSAGLAHLVLGSPALTLPVWRGALAVESSKLLALAAGILVFQGIARIRGWSEFTDLTDGLVYGMVVGLGYSVGETFVRELSTARFPWLHLLETPWQSFWRAAGSGLAHGVFGAMVGLGCGAVLEARSRLSRVVAPVLGLALAVVLNALFRILAHGDALSGTSGLFRAWLAVLLPLAAFIAIWALSLTAERRAIHSYLRNEVAQGLLSENDLRLLESFWHRQLRYWGLLFRGRVADSLHLAARHNRQVQLALILRRLAREEVPAHRSRLTRQAELLRNALRHMPTVVLLLMALSSCRKPAPEGPSTTSFSSESSPSAPAPLEPDTGRADAPKRSSTAPSSERARSSFPTLAGTPLDSLLDPAKRDLDRYWQGQLGGLLYVGPKSVGPYSLTSADCPAKKRNASYCPPEHRIYFDADWFEDFRQQTGDFAPVYILSHEWGHLVQDLRGDLSPQTGLWNLQVELQADCLAGQWTRDAGTRHTIVGNAVPEARATIQRMSDPLNYPWYKSDAHGSGDQRTDAFMEGDEGRTCAGTQFWTRVKVDPDALHEPPTPVAGSLYSVIACRVGRFERVSIFKVPEALNPVVTDAVQATFRAADGVTISYFAIVFVKPPAAQRGLEARLKHAQDNGYQIVKEGPVADSAGRRLGDWYLLNGQNEVVVIRNGHKITSYEGPAGAAWEFGTVPAEFKCS